MMWIEQILSFTVTAKIAELWHFQTRRCKQMKTWEDCRLDPFN